MQGGKKGGGREAGGRKENKGKKQGEGHRGEEGGELRGQGLPRPAQGKVYWGKQERKTAGAGRGRGVG